MGSWCVSLSWTTGCEGGGGGVGRVNFVSSAFFWLIISGMANHVRGNESDEQSRSSGFDFSRKRRPTSGRKEKGQTPSGMDGGKLREWGAKEEKGQELLSWFSRVAPHLDLESGESSPFQILLGQEFLHEHQLVQYRGPAPGQSSKAKKVGAAGAGNGGRGASPRAVEAGPRAASKLAKGLTRHRPHRHSHLVQRQHG
jgi:hypothetical protein